MSPRSLFPILIVAVALLAPPRASADVGVEKVNRTSGKPGASVRLTLGCGACSVRGQDTASFPVSLVSVAKVPKPRRCGPNVLCPPRVRAIPKQPPFTYLGEALPLRDDGDAEDPYPLYVLDFAIPRLPAGTYTYVIYCDLCLKGKAAGLITAPTVPRSWRLRIRPN